MAWTTPFGEASPLGRLDRMNAVIVMIGVGWDTCTALHLAERRAWPDLTPMPAGAPVVVDGARVWMPWREYPHDSSYFPRVGFTLEREGIARIGLVGTAAARLATLPRAIERAIDLLKRLG